MTEAYAVGRRCCSRSSVAAPNATSTADAPAVVAVAKARRVRGEHNHSAQYRRQLTARLF
jgi:hypothetical protein